MARVPRTKSTIWLTACMTVGVLFGIPAGDMAKAQGSASAQEPAPGATIVRRFTLAELGYRAGVALTGLHGVRTIYVPAPRAMPISSIAARMEFTAEQAFDARRSLRLAFEDRNIHTLALGSGGDFQLKLPLDGQPRGSDFLKLDFASSGALSDNRCLDDRIANAFLNLRPASSIDIEVPLAALMDLRTAMALMPRDVVIVGPDRRLTEQEYATALAVARMVMARGGRISFERAGAPWPVRDPADPVWSRARVVIEPPAGSDADISVGIENGEPVFSISPVLSSSALALVGSRFFQLARTDVLSVGPVREPPQMLDRVPLQQLGVQMSPLEFADRGEWFVAWSADDLPAGRMAGRYALDLRIGDDGGALPAVLSVYFNGILVESRRVPAQGFVQLRGTLPAHLQAAQNIIRVVAQRHIAGGECRYAPQAFPAQLLPAGGLLLEPAPAVASFVDLGRLLGPGTILSVPRIHGDRWERSLDLVAGVIGRMGAPARSFTIRFDGDPRRIPAGAGPFIIVSDAIAAAEGGAAPIAPLRLDRGRMAIVDSEGRTLHELNDPGESVIVQVVREGDRSGLWIRPPRDEEYRLAAPVLLEQGDVALVNRDGSASFFDVLGTGRESVQVSDSGGWVDIAERYRTWIIVSLWLAATALFVLILRGMARRNR
ncbi:MAG: hypothetical protein ACRC7G_13480 [Beijerinckiaceae bacterium]